STFQENRDVLGRALDSGQPSILFEDKTLYGHRVYRDGIVSDLFAYDFLDDELTLARVFAGDPDAYDCLIIAPGGMVERTLRAMTELFLEEEITCQLLVPSQLYPWSLEPLLPILERAAVICVAEEGVAGGTWGAELAAYLYERLWGRLRRPIVLLNSEPSIIPAAPHLERNVLLQDANIYRTVKR